MKAFFDTNVILYLAQDDQAKAAIAERLLAAGGVVSVQVLDELAHVARRKFRYDWSQIRTLTENLRAVADVLDLTDAIHRRGLEVAERYQLSVFDGMIVSAALTGGCDPLYSEDMHDGLVINGQLTIVNPFA